jgi:hypothetical protein
MAFETSDDGEGASKDGWWFWDGSGTRTRLKILKVNFLAILRPRIKLLVTPLGY